MTSAKRTLASLASDRFEPLTQAEERVLEIATTPGDLQVESRSARNQVQARPVKRSNCVRGELVRWLCRDSEAGALVDPKGIRVANALIEGPLDLEAIQVHFPLTFVNCAFRGQIILLDAEVRTLNFSGCDLVGLVGDRLSCRGGIWINQGTRVQEEVRFVASKIQGDLTFSGSRLNGLALDSCEASNVYLDDGFSCRGPVTLRAAAFRGDIGCRNAVFDPRTGDGSANHPTSAAAAQDEASTPSAPDAIDAGGMTVGGDVFFLGGFHAHGAVLLGRAKISGSLDCTGGVFSNPGGAALSAIFASIGKEVRLTEGFSAEGTVDFNGATIQGQLICERASFNNAGGDAFVLDGAHIHDLVALRNQAVVRGCVRLVGARLNGSLDCSTSVIMELNGRALFADSAEIGGTVVLVGSTIVGETRFTQATVHGGFACENARLLNHGGSALSAQRLTSQGPLLLHNAFCAVGEVELGYSTIHVGLDCAYGSYSNREGGALNLGGARVFGDVNMSESQFDGSVSFNGAQVGLIIDEPRSWPAPGALDLRGLHYGDLGDILDEAGRVVPAERVRLEWLGRQPKQTFSVQPYEELITWARRSGREKAAVEFAIARQEGLRRWGRLSLPQRVWNWFIGFAIGHGYKTYRLLPVMIILVLVGWVVFAYGASHGAMLPSKPTDPTLPLPANYPRLSPFMYSLDAFLPIIDFHQEGFWTPDGVTRLGRSIQIYSWIHVCVGWFLTTLAVIGFGGLVKKS